MENFKKRICRLCLNTVHNENFKLVEEATKEIIRTVLPTLNLNGTYQHIMCNDCALKLYRAFDFKSACLYVDDSIIHYATSEEVPSVDLREIYLKNPQNKQLDNAVTDYKICRLCMNLVSGEYKSLHEEQVDMIYKYIPEMNFNIAKDPVICKSCFDTLAACSDFVNNCLDLDKPYKGIIHRECYQDVEPKLEELIHESEEVNEEEMLIKIEDIEIKSEGNQEKLTEIEIKSEENTECLQAPQHLDGLNELFKCCLCDHKTTSNNVDTHMLSHRDPADLDMFKCFSCDYKAKYLSIFKRHVLRHKDPSTRHNCDLCGYTSRYENLLKRHMSKHSKDRERDVFSCEKCSYRTNRNSNFNRHKLTHERQLYKCEYCSVRMTCRDNLKKHMLRHVNPCEVLIHCCNFCDYQTRNEEEFSVHLANHSDFSKGTYEVDSCNFESGDNGEHLVPVEASQPSSNIPQPSQPNRTRTVASRCFKRDPAPRKLYKCDKCLHQTSRRYDLDQHKLTHEDPTIRPMYKCHVCNIRVSSKQTLRKHIKRHNAPPNANKYKCNECDYQAKHPCLIAKHEVIHKDPVERKVFQCDLCHTKLNSKHNLKRHMLLHRAPSEIPFHIFDCDVCDYRTVRPCDLVTHKLRHANI